MLLLQQKVLACFTLKCSKMRLAAGLCPEPGRKVAVITRYYEMLCTALAVLCGLQPVTERQCCTIARAWWCVY